MTTEISHKVIEVDVNHPQHLFMSGAVERGDVLDVNGARHLVNYADLSIPKRIYSQVYEPHQNHRIVKTSHQILQEALDTEYWTMTSTLRPGKEEYDEEFKRFQEAGLA